MVVGGASLKKVVIRLSTKFPSTFVDKRWFVGGKIKGIINLDCLPFKRVMS